MYCLENEFVERMCRTFCASEAADAWVHSIDTDRICNSAKVGQNSART